MASLVDRDTVAFCLTLLCVQIGALIAFAMLLGIGLVLGELLSI